MNKAESKRLNKSGFIWLVETNKYVSAIYNNWFQADERARGWMAERRVSEVRVTRFKPVKDGFDWDGTDVVYYKGKPGGGGS